MKTLVVTEKMQIHNAFPKRGLASEKPPFSKKPRLKKVTSNLHDHFNLSLSLCCAKNENSIESEGIFLCF